MWLSPLPLLLVVMAAVVGLLELRKVARLVASCLPGGS
jgi:hypothetical protein